TLVATLPLTQLHGVTVSGKVVVSGGNNSRPSMVVLFSSRVDGQTVMSAIGKDGSFEIKNVLPGIYEARTLPFAVPAVSTSVVVDRQDVTGLEIKTSPSSNIG